MHKTADPYHDECMRSSLKDSIKNPAVSRVFYFNPVLKYLN